MCNNDKFIDETDDWIKFLMDRLGNAKIVSGSDSKSVQVWDAETRRIQGGTKISNAIPPFRWQALTWQLHVIFILYETLTGI